MFVFTVHNLLLKSVLNCKTPYNNPNAADVQSLLASFQSYLPPLIGNVSWLRLQVMAEFEVDL